MKNKSVALTDMVKKLGYENSGMKIVGHYQIKLGIF